MLFSAGRMIWPSLAAIYYPETSATMNRSLISLGQPELWNEAISNLEYAVGHTYEYCLSMSNASGLETFLYFVEDAPCKLICPLSIRKKEPDSIDLVTPFGFGGVVSSFSKESAEALKREWENFCCELKITTAYIAQHPCPDIGSNWRGDKVFCHQKCFVLDLLQPLDNLWKSFSKTHRYEIRKNAVLGSFIADDTDRLTEALKYLYPPTLERVGANSSYFLSMSTLSELCNLPNSYLVGTERNGQIEAVSLFLYSSSCGEYFINAATPSGRMFSRNLIWEAVRYLRQRGVKWLNLGGGIQLGDSLEQFKRGFGGLELPLCSARYIANQSEYERLCRKYCGAFPVTTEYFPPYWRHNVKK